MVLDGKATPLSHQLRGNSHSSIVSSPRLLLSSVIIFLALLNALSISQDVQGTDKRSYAI